MRTKFFTGKGDKGRSEVGKFRVPKDDVLFDALGSIDELNSWVGFCRAEAQKVFEKKEVVGVSKALKNIQEALFIAQAEIASIGFNYPVKKKITSQKTRYLEKLIQKIDGKLPKLDKFVISGESELASRLDLSRVIARNTEREIVKFSQTNKLTTELLRYFNRLSSVLFALSRYVNHYFGVREENPKYR